MINIKKIKKMQVKHLLKVIDCYRREMEHAMYNQGLFTTIESNKKRIDDLYAELYEILKEDK